MIAVRSPGYAVVLQGGPGNGETPRVPELLDLLPYLVAEPVDLSFDGYSLDSVVTRRIALYRTTDRRINGLPVYEWDPNT